MTIQEDNDNGDHSKLVLELENDLQEEKDKEIKKYEQVLADFEKLFQDKNQLMMELATSGRKTHVIMKVAYALEQLYIAKKSDIPTNEISTYLVKKLDGFVASSTVWDNLPTRFKSHKKNPYSNQELETLRNRSENSSLNINFEEENEEEIKITNEIIDFWKSRKNKLMHSHYVSLLPDYILAEEAERRQNLRTIMHLVKILHDNRQSVPIELEHLLINAFATQTNNDAAGIYVAHIKEFGANRSKKERENTKKLAKAAEPFVQSPDTLTSKQAVKILLGHVTHVSEIREPRNRNEALQSGYHGTQCKNEECRSWRTYLDFDASELCCRCHVCDQSFERGVASMCKNCYLPFYDEVIVTMKNTGKEIIDHVLTTSCPQCSETVYLPIKKLVPIVVNQK